MNGRQLIPAPMVYTIKGCYDRQRAPGVGTRQTSTTVLSLHCCSHNEIYLCDTLLCVSQLSLFPPLIKPAPNVDAKETASSPSPDAVSFRGRARRQRILGQCYSDGVCPSPKSPRIHSRALETENQGGGDVSPPNILHQSHTGLHQSQSRGSAITGINHVPHPFLSH